MIEVISILAGGWSVRGIDLNRLPGFVIAVNEAGILAPNVNAIITMDRLWTENRWDDLCLLKRKFWARPNALLNIKERPDWLIEYQCDNMTNEFTEVIGRLNGMNSGACALNLAYKMRPQKIILFGFDMCRSPNGDAYWYKPYSWNPSGGTKEGKYNSWAKQFDQPALAFQKAGIEVWNASPVSRIQNWLKVNPLKVLI